MLAALVACANLESISLELTAKQSPLVSGDPAALDRLLPLKKLGSFGFRANDASATAALKLLRGAGELRYLVINLDGLTLEDLKQFLPTCDRLETIRLNGQEYSRDLKLKGKQASPLEPRRSSSP
jgi:hypothetical protein